MKTLPNLTLPLNGNLTPPELRARLGNGERFELVDVRTHPEFAAGRIAGARLLPLDELESRVRDWDRNLPMICIGRSGRRSAQAAARLARLGFARVHQLEGGLLAWEKAGLPLEKDDRAPWGLERQVRFTAGVLVLAGLGSSWLWPPAIGLTWLVGAGLVLAAFTDWCGMGLLLARMPWNRPTRECAGAGNP